jgi:fructoselysine 6-kinase
VNRRRDVASVGDNCVDVLRSRGDAEVAGGNAFNVAVALARLGRAASYFGAVGQDKRGDLVLDSARAASVDISGVVRLEGATGVTIVEHTPDGERIFAHEDYGAAADYRIAEEAATRIVEHRWIHLARQPDVATIASRKRDGTRISYDAGDHTPPEEIARIAPEVDVLFISMSGGSCDPGQVLEDARAAGSELVVVTCGACGSAAVDRDGRSWSQPALHVADVVDTLGAGDAFIAGFVDSLLDDADIARALARGAASGAQAVARGPSLPGATAAGVSR